MLSKCHGGVTKLLMFINRYNFGWSTLIKGGNDTGHLIKKKKGLYFNISFIFSQDYLSFQKYNQDDNSIEFVSLKHALVL